MRDFGETSKLAEVPTGRIETDRSIKSRLVRARDHHQKELDKINAAIEALNEQPKVAELLETVMRAL